MEFQSSVAEGPADPAAAQRPYLAVESVVMGALVLFCSNRRPSWFYSKRCLSFFSIHVTIRVLNVMFRADPCLIMAHIYFIDFIFHIVVIGISTYFVRVSGCVTWFLRSPTLIFALPVVCMPEYVHM